MYPKAQLQGRGTALGSGAAAGAATSTACRLAHRPLLRAAASACTRAHPRPAGPAHPPPGAPAARAAVNVPRNCALATKFVSAGYSPRDLAVTGSLVIYNPTKSPVAVTWAPILAVISDVPKGGKLAPAQGAGYGSLRPYAPYNGPFDKGACVIECVFVCAGELQHLLQCLLLY